ncbi:MAG: hypothetical protein K9L56_14725 [Clostridiales bacterium]|nr:hypothetical protein [Clostridiales bacterium]
MDIKIIASGKSWQGFFIKLLFITKKKTYKETFYGNQDLLETYKHLIKKTNNIKAKLKFYNKLKQYCPTYESEEIDG